MKGKNAQHLVMHKLGAKARTVTLTTGMLLGVAGTSGGLLTLEGAPYLSHNNGSVPAAYAQTIHRNANDGQGFSLIAGPVYRQSSYIHMGFGGNWAFSLQRGNTGKGQSWVYCINSGLYNGGFIQQVAAIDGNGHNYANQGSVGLINVSLNDLRNAGIINLMEMAGGNGYRGLAKYQNSVFDGIDPDTRVTNIGANLPGSFYALVMQVAVHASETNSMYYHAGGAANYGINLSNEFKRNYHAGGYYFTLSNGQTISSARVAQMADKLQHIARYEYHSPDLNEVAQQSFTLDVQARGERYDRTEANSDDYGSRAETRWGLGADNGNMMAAKSQLPTEAGKNAVASEPVAVTGLNLSNDHRPKGSKPVQVDLALTGITPDKPVKINGVEVTSHPMDPAQIYGFQISKTLTNTGNDDSTNIKSTDIQWDDHLYKLGQNIDFDKLNHHYVRLVVDNGQENGDGHWSWNGFNKLSTKLMVTIPDQDTDFPMAFAYSTSSSFQDYTSNGYVKMQFNQMQMEAGLDFHVRQLNQPTQRTKITTPTPPTRTPTSSQTTTPTTTHRSTSTTTPSTPTRTTPTTPNTPTSRSTVSTTPGTPTTTPGTTPVRLKTIVPVPASFDSISTGFKDKNIDNPKQGDNNNQLDTFSDGKNNVDPNDFKSVTTKQNDTFKSMLSQQPLNDGKQLIPGKEYAYTLHLKTGADIRKEGSEELVQLKAKDVKLPKWFVYKTAVASVGPNSSDQSISTAITKKSHISYKPRADGSGSVNFQVDNLNKDAELMDALKPAITSDDGEVDVTIFGTIDPNAEAKAKLNNEFFGGFSYDSDEKTTHGKTHNPVGTIKQDTIKGVFTGDPQDFLKKVAEVNPKFGKTAGIEQSGNKKGYLSLQSDQIKIGHIRGLNTNETADETGAYGNHSNQVIEPEQYKNILSDHLTIKNQDQQKNLYYVVIANSGNSYGNGDDNRDGFKRLHFTDYLDPNLKLDLKNRPMVAYDLSEMETRKAGADHAILAPFAHTGFLGTNLGGVKQTKMFNATTNPNVDSYMSNIIFDSTSQLKQSKQDQFGVNDISRKAMVNGLGAYVNPTDMKAWEDGVGKVGNKNYTSYYRASKGNGYRNYEELGKIEDTYGSYNGDAHLNGAGKEVGWYQFSHGSVEGDGVHTLRDLDGRQRVSWDVSGADARALSAHTVMFMVPVKVKDDATYVTNNNQTPDIQNDAEYHGSNQETPNTPDSDNPTADKLTGTNHGNGYGWSNTVVINPIRKDMHLEKEQDTVETSKHTEDPKSWTSSNRHENLDDTFDYKLNIQMPNWADKNNLQDMHGRAAKFKVSDKMALPYDVKDIRVYDETDHKVLVPSLKEGIESGQIELDEQKGAWGTSKDQPNYNTEKVIKGPDGHENPLQHPDVIYRPYGDVNGADAFKPQKVFKLANHKLAMQVKVSAPFEQGEDNKRLGKLNNAKTDSLYDEYMEKHNKGDHQYVIPNTFTSTRQSTVDDHNDGSHTSNTITTTYGSKGEINVDAMRIDTNKIAQGDNFKMFFSTKMPYGTSNDDFDGDVHVKVYADKMDNEKLNDDVVLYEKSIPMKNLTNIDKIRTFKSNDGASLIDQYQQGSQAVGKYTLNGNLNVKDGFNKAFGKAEADKLMSYYSGVDLKDATKDGKSIDYLKADKYNTDGSVAENDEQNKYGSHRRPLYVRVKVTADEQTNSRDVSINGDRSFRGSNGKFVDPFGSGMVSRADFAYHDAIDPRFVSVAPESSYAYFGQNRKGLGNKQSDHIKVDAHKGVSMIQTVYDATQLHRFSNDKEGSATKNEGNVDQMIGAGAGDGIRNDVRLQRFGWGNLNATPTEKDPNPTFSTKKMMQSDQLRFLFDSSLENGSGVDYKDADPDAVKTAKGQYYRTTGANVAANWNEPNSFWSVDNGNLDFHEDRARANGFRFIDSHKMKTDKLWANTESEDVTNGRGRKLAADAIFYTVPRATEQQKNLLTDDRMTQPSVYGAPIDAHLTNLQTSQYAVDGSTGVKKLDWSKGSDGYLADDQAVKLVTDNESGITSINNAPNMDQSNEASSIYNSKKRNDELATDAGDFFTTDIGNNYNNYHFYARKLKRGTGQVVMGDNTKGDTDVVSSQVTDNSRGRKMPGFVNGGDKFYLPMWFTNNDEHDTFSRGTGQAVINPLVYFSDGSQDRINADYSDVNFTRWLRVFGHRYGFDGSNSSDYDSILVSGHLDGSSSKALNTSENNALKAMQANKRPAQMPKHVKED